MNLRYHQDDTELCAGRNSDDASMLCCNPENALQLILRLSPYKFNALTSFTLGCLRLKIRVR